MNKEFVLPAIGQLFIIGGLLWTVCWAIAESNRKPRSYYSIFLNRIRYIFYIGFWKFLYIKAHNFIAKFTNKIDRIVLEDHPDNYPWMWLIKNRMYQATFFYIPATLVIIYELCGQMSSGYILKKPIDLFFVSPIRSVSLCFILIYLAAQVRYWKRMYLNVMKRNGAILDPTNKLEKIL